MCIFTENVILDSLERCEEATPVSVLGQNIPGRGQADVKVLRWEWAWCSRNSHSADEKEDGG